MLLGTCLPPVARGDAYYTYDQRSEPQGIIANQSGLYAPGTTLTTATAPLSGSGYAFGYWSLNGERVSDSLGQAKTIATFTLISNTTAIAWYFSPSADTNADGIADYLQWRYYGTLTHGGGSDTDGDGFTLSEELARGYCPLIRDEPSDGGVMMRLSDSGKYRDDALVKNYQIRSDPQGIVSLQNSYTNAGATVATTTIGYASGSGGYTFGYWEVNGVRQAAASGVALPRVMLSMTNDVVAVARYFAAGDADADGQQDWYEWYWFGNLDQSPSSDPDGDGFTIAEEQSRGYNPTIRDEPSDGGVMMRVSDVGKYRDDALVKNYQIRSDPQGIVSLQNSYTNAGATVATTTIGYGSGSGGHTFGYWEVNGVRQAAASGVALPRVMLSMTNDVVAVARYFAAGDADADGQQDWYEWYWFGSLDQSPSSDPDGDGFTIAEEQSRGYNPTIRDEPSDGGVMMRLSDVGKYRDDALVKNYQIRSDPQGIVSLQNSYTNSGATVATTTIGYGASSGYYFGYWEVNGVRQAAASGVALPRVMLSMTNDVVAVARYFASGDGDADGQQDWYEWYWFGNLDQSPSSDPDGDGFTIAEEQSRGYNPTIRDEPSDGGVMMRLSDVGKVGLSYYPRVTQVIVNGVMRSGFSVMGGAPGAWGVSSNAAPAFGDWDGDGTADLVIGGANGQLVFFQNDGSPIVPNFVATPVDPTLAALWTNLGNIAPALGDWSGDGEADLAIGGATNVITLIGSVGGFANAAPERITAFLSIPNTTLAIPALAPPPGTNLCDLYVLRADGTVDRYPNTGVASEPFLATSRMTNLLGSAVANATGLAVADMNKDGIPDVLVSDTYGSIYEFRGRSNQTYLAYGAGFAGSYAGLANRLTLAAGDFYGTGDRDILGGFAEGGLLCLKNPTKHLLLDPPGVTLLNGQSAQFSALNAASAVTWSLALNPSGGSINPTNGQYTAGTATGMDFVEARAADGMTGRAYVNVISPDEVAGFGKAIVVGGGKDLADPVWLATDYIASRAYNVLRYKGYSRENIRYLSFDPGRDVDGDGLDNDIAGFSSHANVAGSFTNWTGNANRLLVYLVDHGSATPDGAYFRLNTGENLTSTQLDAWLDAIQDEHGTEVVVVLDFCYAGRFLQDLTYAGPAKRVVIAATSPGELTYFLSGGLVSFSDLFLSGLLQGLDLEQAFLFARQGMEGYQNGTLDDDGNGLYQPGVDGSVAATIPVGATHLAGKDVPVIGSVAPNQTLHVGTKATLWAEGVESYYPIDRVYCTIIPPSFSASTNAGVPVTAMSEVELTPQAGGRYAAEVDRFAEPGLYKINYYARDIWGSVSPPRQGLVTQAGFDERMAIVAGGSTNDPGWRAISRMASTAYQTALARRLNKTGIRYLSAATHQDLDGDGTNDVHAAASAAALAETITGWAAGANRLTVCLLGTTTSGGQYRIGAAETLPAGDLDGWLDTFQISNSSAIVVLDFDGCGGYVPALAPPAGKERIVLASTKAGAPSVRAADGLISFSQFFLSGIFNGRSLGAAFADARNAIRYASGRVRQTAQLDDSGNGVPDQKNIDGLVAAGRYLGAAFATGEDTPSIGSVTPPTNLVQGTPLTLWAASVLSGAGISNVWCAITPPDYDGLGELPQTNLAWSAPNNRYEAPYADFTLPGDYALTFYALDNAGLLSAPAQSSVTATDPYEPDDTNLTATIFVTEETQTHNLHAATDEDWVMFYAPTGFAFNIDATQLGDNSDLAMDIYYESPGGDLELIEHVDDPFNGGTGSNVIETTYLDLKTGTSGLEPGIYLVRVSSADTNLFGPGSDYELRIYEPVGGAGGVNLLGYGVSGFATLRVTLGPPAALAAGGAWKINNLEGDTWHSNNDTTYILPVRASGSYRMIFRDAEGFTAPAERNLDPDANETLRIDATYAAAFAYTNPVPQLVSMSLGAGGVFQFSCIAAPGNYYAIEQSTNLLHWVPLGTNLVPSDGALPFSITNDPHQPRAFYRWRLVE